METKNYLLLARTNTGAIVERVTIFTDFVKANEVLRSIMEASKSTIRGEIIEGTRDFIGDFRVKPLLRVFRDKDGAYTQELV